MLSYYTQYIMQNARALRHRRRRNLEAGVQPLIRGVAASVAEQDASLLAMKRRPRRLHQAPLVRETYFL